MEDVEIWKDIAGYEGLYQASNYGRIRSLPRYVNGRGVGMHRTGGRTLKGIKLGDYLGVQLSKENEVKKTYIHRLIASTFIPNPKHLPEINHIDGNKHNNAVPNLEWVTHSQNGIHAYAIGLKVKAGGTPPKRVRIFCKDWSKEFDSIADAADYVGISQSSISRCCSGERNAFFGQYHAEYL